jgi:uncharacterized protein (TIGR03905 family)
MKIFYTQGVCAKKIIINIEEDILKEVTFVGGCNGNLLAIKKLIEGMPVSEVISKLQGTPCGNNTTSCADQLAQALKGYAGLPEENTENQQCSA